MEMTMNKISVMLDLIVDIVDDDNTPWTEKRDRIKAALEGNERIKTAFEEFMAWFEEAEDA
jgi:hypothetical protein